MKIKLPALFKGNQLIIFLLILGCMEFSIAAVFNLSIEPDPKNALLFGYSFPRLILSGLLIILAGWLLLLAWSSSIRARVLQRIDILVQKVPLATGLGVLLLAGLAIMIGLAPFEIFGRWGLYFARVRLILFVLFLYPAQFSLYWLQARKWDLDLGILRPFLLSLSTLTALAGGIVISGWGITPDNTYWNPAGSPLTSLQLVTILWIGMLLFGLFGLVKTSIPNKSNNYFDLLMVLCLFVIAIYSWLSIPNPYNEFSVKPTAPYFQPYPSSDAATYDLGAISILNGSGINLGHFSDKALYFVFLAFLHLLGGFDYNLLTTLHTGFMALMIPALYLWGKTFHSRMFGFVLAATLLIRQYNAVVLTNRLYFNVTPRQFMSEVPTMVGLIFFTWAFFLWIKNQDDGGWRAFVAGGILAAVSMIRSNPLLLILFVPVFLFFSTAKNWRVWLKNTLVFLTGCAIVISPWVVSSKSVNGIPSPLYKFYDIIQRRYQPTSSASIEKVLRSDVSLDPIELAQERTPLIAGLALPPIPIKTFPGFVINNTLHNFVGAFLALPDSISIDDQDINNLVSRPYWAKGVDSVTAKQIPFLLLNLTLLALGLGWAWKRWKWAGLTPLFVFGVYSLSLGFGRTSGSRYLVPLDWVVNFYFAIGIISLFQLLPNSLRRVFEIDRDEKIGINDWSGQHNNWLRISSLVLVLFLAALIPIAQTLIPPKVPICQSGSLKNLLPGLQKQGLKSKVFLVYGAVLYPEIDQDQLSFTLLTCQRSYLVVAKDFHGNLTNGQEILAGLAGGGNYPNLAIIAMPPINGANPLIVWKEP